jgi:hypothetical protein
MNIQELERSQKIYAQIKDLDAEIIEIEKVAILVANGNAEVNLSLNVKDTTPKKEESEKVEFDEDGSFKSSLGSGLNFRMGIISPWGTGESLFEKVYGKSVIEKEDNSGSKLKACLSENLSLNVLAILLYDKQTRRAKLIKSLNRIGVTL